MATATTEKAWEIDHAVPGNIRVAVIIRTATVTRNPTNAKEPLGKM